MSGGSSRISFPELRSALEFGAVFARPGGVFGFAQVGEWLKPTDCKSVPLRRYGGSNPPLCTRVAKENVSKFQGCKVSKENIADLGSLKP